MKLTILGTGTSTGIPQMRCHCAACRSADPHDRRLRASAMVSTGGRNLLIDCGPDFRQQMLRAGSPDLDALLVTHSHYDHVGGIDDLRPWCHSAPFAVHCTADVEADLRARLPYCFTPHPYPGVPVFDVHRIDPRQPFAAAGIAVTPLPVLHMQLPIVGFRIGPLAYVTDCLTMPAATRRLLHGIDTLVINALRIAPHISHMNLDQALTLIAEIAPRRALLTHISHDMGPEATVAPGLPPGVSFAHDGMVLDIPDNGH